MTATSGQNVSSLSDQSLGFKGRFFIEDLTDNDRTKDLQDYLSQFGILKFCNINKGGNFLFQNDYVSLS